MVIADKLIFASLVYGDIFGARNTFYVKYHLHGNSRWWMAAILKTVL